jgi:hypothetical protein
LKCKPHIFFCIGLLSATIIAYELSLLQIFSYVQWYHFAYMVISIALLGFGAAGTALTIFKNNISGKFKSYFPSLMFLCAASIPASTAVSLMTPVRFDSMLLFYDGAQIWKLFVTYLVLFVPFFFGAAALGFTFIEFPGEIGKVYFANLLGSGAGAAVIIGLMWWLQPNAMPAVIGFIVLAAGVISVDPKSNLPDFGVVRLRQGVKTPCSKRHGVIILFGLVSGTSIIYFLIFPPELKPSEFKGITKILNLPASRIVHEGTSPYGLLQVVESPTLRYAPGLSTVFHDSIHHSNAVFNNGDWVGPLGETSAKMTTLNYMTSALPYAMNHRSSVLVVDAGTGMEIQRAILNQAEKIWAAEPNSEIAELLKNTFSTQTDRNVHPAGSEHWVKIENTEARTFLASVPGTYDLIILPIIESFGGSGGIYALKEQYTLTVESFREMLSQLKKDGAVSVTTWIDYPMRNALKICATIVAALREEGKTECVEYLAAIRSWGTITFVVKNNPFAAEEEKQIREFCTRLKFDPMLLPNIEREEKDKFNTVQDNNFFEYFDRIVRSETDFLADYKFNIEPATDEKPYFSQFIKIGSIPELRQVFGGQGAAYFELGYFITFVTLLQIAAAAAALILIPLLRLRSSSRGKFKIFLYFAGIGLGYIFTEIILIQRFTLFFGNTVYAAASVIGIMLISSGVGSYFSSTVFGKVGLKGLIGLICLLLLAYSSGLMPILRAGIHLPGFAKIILSIIIIGLPAFFMGVPFPAGLKNVSESSPDLIAWAWGVNGCFSVIGTAAATLLAAEFGFVWVMIIAALVYSMTGFSHLGWAR